MNGSKVTCIRWKDSNRSHSTLYLFSLQEVTVDLTIFYTGGYSTLDYFSTGSHSTLDYFSYKKSQYTDVDKEHEVTVHPDV